VMTLIQHWFQSGSPAGETPFASFPEWARVVGGVMRAAGLGDPCLPDLDSALVGGDEETAHMKLLFATAYEKWESTRVDIKQISNLLADEDAQLFHWLPMDEHRGKTAFAILVRKFVNRILGNVALRIHDREKQ
jgi:hypothetical protein